MLSELRNSAGQQGKKPSLVLTHLHIKAFDFFFLGAQEARTGATAGGRPLRREARAIAQTTTRHQNSDAMSSDDI